MSKTCFQHGRRVGGAYKPNLSAHTPTPNPSPQGGGGQVTAASPPASSRLVASARGTKSQRRSSPRRPQLPHLVVRGQISGAVAVGPGDHHALAVLDVEFA